MAVGHKEFTQKKPLQLVYLELGVGNGGMLLSISEDGFRFRAVSPVRENSTMPFVFSLDSINHLDGVGTVEWVEEDGKSGGMRFTEVSPEFQAALGAWLNSDSSHHAGREVTPAAATPLDTMEKIRGDLRSGYPKRPAEVTKFPERQPEEKPELKPEPDQKIVDRSASDKNIFKKEDAGKPAAGKNPAPKTKRTIFESAPEKTSKAREPLPPNRVFPLPAASEPQPEKPAAASSAFLKSPNETKTPNRPAASAATDSKNQSATRDKQAFPATSAFRGAAPSVPESHELVPAPTRPFIPPLEESFEQAWEQAKLTSPADSPHLSRAAAGSIIAIALAVILGAVAYNFRLDIGTIFIQLGQSISGENRPAAPPPAQETKPDTSPAEDPNRAQGAQPAGSLPSGLQPAGAQPTGSQTANTPAESGNAANPPASAGEENSTTDTGASGTTSATNDKTGATSGTNIGDAKTGATGGTKTGAAPTRNSQHSARASVPAVVKPLKNSPAQVAVAPERSAANAASGQEEFAIARDILHSSSRQQDFSKAVALLWSSVRKGHVPAEVTLADLYRRGDGVEKNCDQARVLLVAASKKGSVEARQMLEQIAERGCE
jgi:hypothetical protein